MPAMSFTELANIYDRHDLMIEEFDPEVGKLINQILFEGVDLSSLAESTWDPAENTWDPDECIGPFMGNTLAAMNFRDKVLHDCMWNGHCRNRDMHMNEVLSPLGRPSVVPPVLETTRQQTIMPTSSRSLLIKPAAAPMPSTDSPPLSDDEDNKKCSMGLVTEAIDQVDSDEMSAEIVERYEKEMAKQQASTKTQYVSESDHSYHKGKYMWSSSSLGLDTPSDSDDNKPSTCVRTRKRTASLEDENNPGNDGENQPKRIKCIFPKRKDSEIDVVSVVSEKNVLPNNPTSRDRQQLQKTMATAINNKTRGTGLKVILPVRSQPMKQQTKRNNHRGAKRKYGGDHHGSMSKRHQGDNYDSDTSEKRTLHNNMERQRRIGLRDAFENLRKVCPSIEKKDKAAKVLILNEANKFIHQLMNTDRQRTHELQNERKRAMQLLVAMREKVYERMRNFEKMGMMHEKQMEHRAWLEKENEMRRRFDISIRDESDEDSEEDSEEEDDENDEDYEME